MTPRSCHRWRAALLAGLLLTGLPPALTAQPAPIPTPAVKPVFTPRNPSGSLDVSKGPATVDVVLHEPMMSIDRAAEGWLTLNLSSHDMPLDADSDPGVPRRYGDVGALDRETSDHNNRTPETQGDWEARWRAVLAALVSGGTFVPAQGPARSAMP